MKVLIIEDEEITGLQLKTYLQELDEKIKIVGPIMSIEQGRTWFLENDMPDLIFSDIELLDGNVFILYAEIYIKCPIIFTTAYDTFLLKAFQGKGISYILKPYAMSHVKEAFSKYLSLKDSFTGAKTIDTDLVEELIKSLSKPDKTYKQRFTVKLKNGIHLLSVESIKFFQADEGIIFAHEQTNKRHALNGTLSDIESNVDPKIFFRINRSEIINIDYIEKIETYFGDRLCIKIKGVESPLITSTNRTADFRKWIE